ncbi:MAG: hypothetical protein JO159_11620 [Acidobacteria bacterium]|nr:hypothetical protein [Acidobacteriota bacterium]MBV9623263.1 hypothetical protein [Acidobacteriota bacterium]
MRLRAVAVLFAIFPVGAGISQAGDKNPSISEQHRMELIRTFNADLVYIRTQFPMGKVGLTLKAGKLSPSGEQLDRLLAIWGPSVKPGDRALITQFQIRNDRIHLEINGGPVRKSKWYQHLQIGAGGGMMTPGGGQPDPINNPRGSYVDLVFDHQVPDLTTEQLKQMLRPVFDFDSKSPLEAYLETVPPKVRDAIKNHQVLVGMNREMVIFAKGRPEKKIREKDGETEYEDWIYGDPPHDVDFVRVVSDQVVRVETMKVGGEKTVRTEKEVDLGGGTIQTAAQKEERPVKAPTLRRPGEEAPRSQPGGSSSPAPSRVPDIPAPPTAPPS